MIATRDRRPNRQAGVTLLELLTVIGITTMLLALSAIPLRSFWFAQTLTGATDALVTNLRKMQEDSSSQSFPFVFGARFVPGAEEWTLYRFDPNADPSEDACTSETRGFTGGSVFNAEVVIDSVTITNDTAAEEHVECRSAVTDKIMFFYARGTATGGSVVLRQPISGGTTTIGVSALTGRVTRS